MQADTKTLPLSIAPDWFVRFSGLHGEDASTGLIVGGMRYGTLDIKMMPVSAINRVWESFRNHLLILILAIGLDFIGILLILKNGLKPLDAVEKTIVRDYSGRTNVESLEQRVAGHRAYFGRRLSVFLIGEFSPSTTFRLSCSGK